MKLEDLWLLHQNGFQKIKTKASNLRGCWWYVWVQFASFWRCWHWRCCRLTIAITITITCICTFSSRVRTVWIIVFIRIHFVCVCLLDFVFAFGNRSSLNMFCFITIPVLFRLKWKISRNPKFSIWINYDWNMLCKLKFNFKLVSALFEQKIAHNRETIQMMSVNSECLFLRWLFFLIHLKCFVVLLLVCLCAYFFFFIYFTAVTCSQWT